MPTPIRVLIVEDSEPDARLLVRELRHAEYEPAWKRVETPEAMREALERQSWDIILSDYKMPHFSGPAALRLLQEMGIDLPFIMVSGTIGEETAVEAMRAGAQDYLLKGNLTRLAPAIVRELREADVRQARRQAEADLRMVNRGLRILSSVNQALLRATAEQELFQQVCDIAATEGGYRLVWVGLALDDVGKTVCPVCHAGHDGAYLTTMRFSWDAESALGRGPTGTAIRTGQPVFIHDIADAPEYAPWREEALQRGYRSLIALPLTIENRIIGALNLYGEAPDAFPAAEVNLLSEMANNMAYGIMALRAREERTHAEAALHEQEAHLHLITDNSPDAIIMIDEASVIRFANPATEAIFGYPLADLLGQSITRLMPERYQTRHRTALREYLATGQRHFPTWRNNELFGLHRDGREIPLEISVWGIPAGACPLLHRRGARHRRTSAVRGDVTPAGGRNRNIDGGGAGGDLGGA